MLNHAEPWTKLSSMSAGVLMLTKTMPCTAVLFISGKHPQLQGQPEARGRIWQEGRPVTRSSEMDGAVNMGPGKAGSSSSKQADSPNLHHQSWVDFKICID